MMLTLGLMTAIGAEVPFTAAFPPVEKVEVAAGEPESVSEPIVFPSLKGSDGMAAVLKVNLRMVTKVFGGWNPWCAIELNGKDIQPKTANGTPRLLLRGSVLHTTLAREAERPYWRQGAHPQLMTYFAPADAVDLDPRILDREFGYDYYLDVDDIVNKVVIGADDRIEEEKPNTLRFFNVLSKTIADCPLLVKNIQLGWVPREKLNELKGIRMWRLDKEMQTAAVLDGDGFSLAVSPSGGMAIAFGNKSAETVFVESAYSYPQEPEMGFNRLEVVAGQDTGNVSVVQNGAAIDIVLKGKAVQVKRELSLKGRRIAVREEITNLQEEDLGLIWRQEASCNGVMPKLWRLTGLTGIEAADVQAAENPTAFLSDGRQAVGFVVEDTVSRILLDMHMSGNTCVFGSRGVGLPSKGTLIVEWSIYPLGREEIGYFDFINRVREDWGVNNTVPGPYLIKAEALPGLRLGLASVQPWLDYAGGMDLTRDEYKAKVTPQIAELKKQFPGILLMGLIETNLVKFDSRTVPWGEQLPLTYADRSNPKTRYGQYLSLELSKKLEAVTPYRDSLLHDAEGRVMIDNYYVYQPKPYINLMPQVERGNHRYNVFMEQVDFLMKNVKFDGVYIDQFNPTMRDGVSYDRWDGRSVKIDKSGKIIGRFYNYAITGAEGRMDIVKRIRELGGVVLTNGHPVTKEEQNSGRLSFAEMENDPCNPLPFIDKKPPEFRYQAKGHLASPIILNLRPRRYQSADGPDLRAKILMKGMITAVRNGVLPYYYGTEQPLEGSEAGSYELANWLFPFTPVKLGEGVLQGKERTITVISGTYRIGGTKRPSVARFDDHGRPCGEEGIVVSGQPNDWTVTVTLKDWNEMACMVRRD